MAKLLIPFPQRAGLQANAGTTQSPEQLKSEPYRVSLNGEVLAEIVQNFAGIPKVIPLLSIGNNQCGRASTLEAFLDDGNEGSFSSEDKSPGVYVWTRPVPLQGVSLLLVKMWGVDFISEGDKELDLITKKVMIALMSISSICLFCGEKTTMFQSLTAIYEFYTPIEERLDLKVSKFLVFVEREATLAHLRINNHREAFNSRQFKNPPEILYRGKDGISATCKESLLQIVGNLQNHQAILDFHARAMKVMETPDMVSTLVLILKTILDISSKDFDFQNFIHRIPNFTSPDFRAEMQLVKEMDEISKSVLAGTALEFFDETTETSTS